MSILRTVFCILAVFCVAAVIPLGIFFGWYCLLAIAAAFLFFGATLLAKRAAEPKPLPKPDFFNSEEENEKINEQRREHEED